jgi:hypothetical protein
MSRVLSANAVRAMFSPETDETLITLLTIYSPVSSANNVYLSDNFTGRLSETDEEVIYGVTSRSTNYLFLPLEISLPSEGEDGASNCTITLNYVTPQLINLIRTELTAPTKIRIELVLSGSPNTVEAVFDGFYIIGATYSSQSVQLTLGMVNYSTEPFPAYGFTPRYFPGLF